MKIRFYSIKDLYEEVSLQPYFQTNIVRMQFLQSSQTQEYRGGGQKSYLPTTEQILTLSVLRQSPSGDKVYYYSQPFARCITHDLKDKAKEIDEKQKALESKVRETFKGWTIRKGIYEVVS